MNRGCGIRGILLLAALAGLAVEALHGQIATTSLLSVRSDGTPSTVPPIYNGNGGDGIDISADGRYVAFSSVATLVLEDTNEIPDLFVKDRLTGRIVRVNVATDGTQAQIVNPQPNLIESFSPAISPDGRLVAFTSLASNLVPNDTDGRHDLFLHDRDADEDGVFDEPGAFTTTSIGLESVAYFDSPSFSSDGRLFAYRSGSPSGAAVLDRQTGQTVVHPIDVSNGQVVLSGNGRYIVHVIRGPAPVVNQTVDARLMVFDRQTGTSVIVSKSNDGALAAADPDAKERGFGLVSEPAISHDGRFVAFDSIAANLVPNDTNGVRDVFLHDRDADGDGVFDEPGAYTTRRVSVSSEGAEGNDDRESFLIFGFGSLFPTMSADGRYVGFASRSSNLVPNDTNNALDSFVHDVQTGRTTRINVASDGEQQPSQGTNRSFVRMSRDGRYVVLYSVSPLAPGPASGPINSYLHDRLAFRIDAEGGAGGAAAVLSQFPGLSGNGQWTIFSSPATTLVPGDTNGVSDVFARDRRTNAVTRLSLANDGTQADAAATRSASDRDGRFIAFASSASNLVAGDVNAVSDIFVRDRDEDGDGVFDEAGAVRTSRVSVTVDGLGANASSDRPDISTDGASVAFASAASNLAIGDTNGVTDVFVHTRATRATVRVSVASDGTQGSGASDAPSISATGRFVAFESAAASLVAGDTNGAGDVFVRDRDSDGNGVFDEPGGATTTRVSVGPGSQQAVAGSNGASISGDGRFVAFASSASNLVTGDTNGQTDVFVHDRLTGVTTRVSVGSLRNNVAAQGNGASDSPAISADGLLVAFRSSASNLVPSDTNGVADIFLHNRALGQTTRVSLRRDGTQTDGPSFAPSVSEDGKRVVYGTTTLGGTRPGDPARETVADTEGSAARGPNPFITAMAPQRLPLAGGLVTFAGAEFEAGFTVEVGGQAATGVEVLSGGRLRATAPAGSAGSRDVVVRDADGRGVAFLPLGLTYGAQLPCATGLSSDTVQQGAGGGGTGVQVTAPAGCGYIASTQAPWMTLAGDTGLAGGTLTIQLTANPSRQTRSGTVLVNERTIAVTQLGIYGTDTDNDGMPDGFELLFGVTDPSADADGDGVTNRAEYEQGTDPTLPNVWNLSEGATGFFAERLALANPGIEDAEFSVRFLREGSAPIDRSYVLPAQRRLTIDVNAIDGLANEAVSAVVTTTRGGVVVERTMRWDARDGTFYGGHTGKAITAPRTQWYLAEGEARFFDTYILLANPGTTAAQVTAQYLLESGTTVTRQYTVNPQARVTVYANAIHGVTGNAFSTDVKSDVPIAVERAMYFSTSGRFWNGGHEVAAVAAPATEWFVAEGRTGPFFDMYLLLANPGTASVSTTIRFLKPDGSVVTQTRTLAATSRTTIHVDGVAGLADTDVSAAITATGPIIVERAMYWPDPFSSWYEAHASAGVTQSGVKWVLAEGETGGALNHQTFVLLANPGAAAATVRLTYLRKDAAPLTRDVDVPANGRLTTSAAQVALASGEQFGVVVESTNGVPIVVERALYWDALGQFWGAGTNETAVRIR